MLPIHASLELLRKFSLLFFPTEIRSQIVLALRCLLCIFVSVVYVTLAHEYLIGLCDDVMVVMSMLMHLLRLCAMCLGMGIYIEALAEGFGK